MLMYEKETLKVEEVTRTLLSTLKMKKNGDNSQAIELVVICKAIVKQSQSTQVKGKKIQVKISC